MSLKRPLLYLIAIVIILTIYFYATGKRYTVSGRDSITDTNLPFQYNSIYLTRHTKERMACRQIELGEIEEVLKVGNINYQKSEISKAACKTRYAIEGRSSEGQHIRLIVAPCEKQLTIVTVIDMENDQKCD